ncbi:hypothetical protein GALMADRAFT_262478 [Galerina marginata CBS 339.88]|uniref:Uncharacterized protein n=1 Tax=Galerina marginata (strain CBS 339.88) TaxID=685588 RepID=A0A067TLM1_GALM3|nr:hypothetical protein GALMADRAFT_262478 [Galerina marginata CBS 339.88]
MSAEQYTQIEQDPLGIPGENELPSYDDLASQNGPNSRFGRWRGWIEKRAAERYTDITPEERARRRERGWGNDQGGPVELETPPPVAGQTPNPPTFNLPLHIQTASLSIQEPPLDSGDDTSTLSAPLPFVSQPIEPTHLKINHFGSRFLPHTTSQIRCVLPLLADRILLVGHDDGLSVLDMFPQEWTEAGDLTTKGPDEAQCRLMWRGECVYQMSVLEAEDHGTGTPQGVVLAVVGPSQHSLGKDPEAPRTARMYNLASLISLARWTIAQKGSRPLDLHKMSTWQTPNTPSKKHRTQGSIARGIKSLIDSPPNPAPEPTSSYQSFLSPSGSIGPSLARCPTPERGSNPPRRNSDESGWDMVEDLPLRWATDFVPLASPGSRLAGASVIAFATWSDESRKGKGTGGQLLAIATKSNIFLYETPKGERAYRFVKEFYTPLQPRSLAFIQQTVTDSRNPLEERSPGRFHSHKRSDSGGTLKGVVSTASTAPLSYGTHLSIFVVFDKKAGFIRLADSVVGEIELGEDGGPQPAGLLYSRDTFSSTVSSASLRQRARVSFDIRESASKWILPVRCDLPVPGQGGLTQPVHIVTRGKRTHVLPCPLPTKSSLAPPLHAIFWKSHPKHVSARLIPAGHDPINDPALLQLVAFGENGLEIQEMGISFMNTKGKGRAFPDEMVRAEEDFGSEAGFLAAGGNWDRLAQIYGSSSAASVFSMDSVDSTDIYGRIKQEEGIYGWYRKGLEDWRVFWVGGGSPYVSEGGATGLGYRDSTSSSMYL